MGWYSSQATKLQPTTHASCKMTAHHLILCYPDLVITLANVSKSFNGRSVLTDIGFSIAPSEFVCITGASGAGKSTMIDMFIGAQKPDTGTVTVDTISLEKVPPKALQLYRQRIGIVFQDYKLLWNLTVRENIAYPLEILGVDNATITSRVDQLLKEMNLQRQQDTLARSLSGGEKARTAIARAIAHKPMILFADEPTGNLDPHESVHVMKILKTIHSQGATVVVATHDFFLVDALNTRVIRIEDGGIARDSVGAYEEEQPASTKKAVDTKLEKIKVQKD